MVLTRGWKRGDSFKGWLQKSLVCGGRGGAVNATVKCIYSAAHKLFTASPSEISGSVAEKRGYFLNSTLYVPDFERNNKIICRKIFILEVLYFNFL